MSEFDSGGKKPEGKKSGGSSIWDSLKTIGRGVLEGFAGGATGAPPGPAAKPARGGVHRKVDRRDPLEGERKLAVSQVHRSLKAWRDEQQAAGPAVQRKPQIPSGGGNPLPGGVQSKMERKLGADLSQVKVHTGGDSEKASEDLNAKAFTVGNDVHFNTGEFDPGNKEGEKLLAHELTHVVQGQKGGVQRKEESDGGDAEGADGEAMEVSDPDEPAEKEADEVSEKVVNEGDEKGAVDTNSEAPKVSRSVSSLARKIFRSPTPAPAGTSGLSPEQLKVLNSFSSSVAVNQNVLGDLKASKNIPKHLSTLAGGLVEQIGASAVEKRFAPPGTSNVEVWSNVLLQPVDDKNANVGGPIAELDFLVVPTGAAPGGSTKFQIVSAKLQGKDVKQAIDIGMLQKFYDAPLDVAMTTVPNKDKTKPPIPTTKIGEWLFSTAGFNMKFANAKGFSVTYSSSAGGGKMSLAAFRARFPNTGSLSAIPGQVQVTGMAPDDARTSDAQMGLGINKHELLVQFGQRLETRFSLPPNSVAGQAP